MSGAGGDRGGGERPASVGAWVLFAFGAAGLLGAASTDLLAMIGRRVGAPFLGSVEVAQVCVLLAGGASLVAATLGRDHAAVRVFTEKASPRLRGILGRVACLTAAAFFAVLTIGSAWIMWDLRDGAEQTELLAIPVVVLRAFWLACAIGCTVVLLAQAFKRSEAS